MTVYVVVDLKGNVYGVCNSKWEVDKAEEKLKNKYPNEIIDYIECKLNEIEADGEIV